MICETMAGDNRFEIIAKAKHAILDGTNIETDEDEMKVLDNILFRCWQMGWLDKYDDTKKQTGWIPVSERLPEKDGSYLVCMSWNYHKMDVLMWADGWNCTRNINGKVNRKSEILGAYILAWMPLPEPYREDGEA